MASTPTQHAASLAGGVPGVLHGNKTLLLQDGDGQITEAHSISAGLDYPGIGPEHAWLHSIGRVEYQSATDAEALASFQRLLHPRRHHPGARTGPRAGGDRTLRAGDAEGRDHRRQSVRARRQGGDRFEDGAGPARVGQAAGEQQPQVLLGGDDGHGVFVGLGRDDHLGENLDDGGGGGGIEPAVHRHDAAEGRHRVATQRHPVCLEQAGALGHAAGVGVLDDRHRRRSRNSATSSMAPSASATLL